MKKILSMMLVSLLLLTSASAFSWDSFKSNVKNDLGIDQEAQEVLTMLTPNQAQVERIVGKMRGDEIVVNMLREINLNTCFSVDGERYVLHPDLSFQHTYLDCDLKAELTKADLDELEKAIDAKSDQAIVNLYEKTKGKIKIPLITKIKILRTCFNTDIC